MGDVLAEIVARKRADVAERLAGVSLESLRAGTQPTARSLAAALRKPGGRFIMEVKRASPSEGSLRADADPVAVARAYSGAADAISVLTDTPYFGGSLADLEAVRAVFDGPILAKDFVIDPRQIAEARRHGADAVLVMLSVLDDAEAATMIAEARQLGMDALIETHDETEIARAIALDAPIIGINNRNLKTLGVDLATTERLAGLIPSDRIVVAESGIASRADVDRLAPYADAFLVGSSLMRSANPREAARALVYGRVKVCGLTDPEDLARTAAAGATYAGMIMVPGTPRAVDARKAETLASAAKKAGVPLVAVFRNEKMLQVAAHAHAFGLAAVQLQGQEDAAYIRGLKRMLPKTTELWTASAVDGAVADSRIGADRTIYDTAVGGRSGGTGIAFDWSLLAGRADLGRSLLAGGLGPGNAREAARIGAFAIDLCSGVEATPGRKDPDKLDALFEALRPVVREEIATC